MKRWTGRLLCLTGAALVVAAAVAAGVRGGSANPRHAASAGPALLEAQLGWVPRGPGGVEFTVRAQFRADAFGGAGASVRLPGGAGAYYCPTCATGTRARVGDIIFDAAGGSRLVFGDGTDSPILSFEVVERDDATNRLTAVAIDPLRWNRGQRGERVRGIRHTYTRPGPFTAGLSTCCREDRTPPQNGLFRVASARIEAALPQGALGIASPTFAVWRGIFGSKGWQILFRAFRRGKPIGKVRSLSLTSTANDDLCVSDTGILYTGVDPADGARKAYYLQASSLKTGPIHPAVISPQGFLDNREPKVGGDWAIGTGWNGGAGRRDVWARNVVTMDPPRILSAGAGPSLRHVAIDRENALFSSRDAQCEDTHVFWQDLIDPQGPVMVSDLRSHEAAASGDIYRCLRCYEGWNPQRCTRDIFFRTVPIVPENPSVVLSTTSFSNNSPQIMGVQAVFEGTDPQDASRNIYFVPDVTTYHEGMDQPARLTDANSRVWPREDRPLNEGAYMLGQSQIAWVGIGQDGIKRIFARDLSTPTSVPVMVSRGTVENLQPWIGNGFVAWRGLTAAAGRSEIYTRCPDRPTMLPIRVNTDESTANEWPFLLF